MQISVFNPILYDRSFEEALCYLKALGINSIELGCGGYPGTSHADAKILIKDKAKLEGLRQLLTKYQMSISALSVHGNPVHPDKEIAAGYDEDFKASCILAKLLEVDTIVTFSGCPGGSEKDTTPNWITCPWPPDFLSSLEYQWKEVLIPYWKKAVSFALENSVTKIALEMHPGFCVYNGESLLKLRAAVGDTIGANFDPSHLIWQGIKPLVCLKNLLENNAVYHFHAKDTAIDSQNTALNGVLDVKHYKEESKRSWIFRTIGYGQGDKEWKDMLSLLNMYGYKGAVSIEHEDSLMTPSEGLEKAIAFLKSVIINEDKPKSIGWA